MRVYLGGPINGCSDEEAKAWREVAATRLRAAGMEPVDPMRRDYRGREHLPGVAEEIVRGDLADIDSCDVCLFMCPRPSYGTAMEMFYAKREGKTVISVTPTDVPLSPWLQVHSNVCLSLELALDLIVFIGLTEDGKHIATGPR